MKFSLFFVPALLSIASALAMPVEGDVAETTAADAGPARQDRTCADLRRAVPFYRAYNADIMDHFYTTNANEFMNAVQNLGYKNEGVEGFIFPSQERDTVPLFRLWNPSVTDHFYTIDINERNRAIRELGYQNEGIAGFVYARSMCSAIPLFRMYNAAATDHFFTISATERNTAQRTGYVNEGVGAWVLHTNKLY